jgi:hypothetical protein
MASTTAAPPCGGSPPRSDITITPIAYGDVNDGELRDIAASRESAVCRGEPQRILPLIHDLFQTTH